MGADSMIKFTRYIKIPNEVLKMTKLTSNDKLLYGILNSLSAKSGVITAKNDFLAETVGLSIHQVKRSLKVLNDIGLIEVINPNRYREIKLIPLSIYFADVIADEIKDFQAVKDENLKARGFKTEQRQLSNTEEQLLDYIYQKM